MFTLLVASASPVVEVILMAAVGLFLARRGKLTNDGKKMVAGLVYLVFAPCLTFTKLATVVSLETLRLWWPLWLNVAAGIFIGAVMGILAAKLLRLPQQYRTLVTAACAFGNVGNLPLVLMDAICTENHSPFASLMAAESCVSYGIGYVVFGMCMATLMVFSVALPVLRHAAAEMTRIKDLEALTATELTQLHIPDDSPQNTISSAKRQKSITNGMALQDSSSDFHGQKHKGGLSCISEHTQAEDEQEVDGTPFASAVRIEKGPRAPRTRCDSTSDCAGRRPDAAALATDMDNVDGSTSSMLDHGAEISVRVEIESDGGEDEGFRDRVSDDDSEMTEQDGLLGPTGAPRGPGRGPPSRQCSKMEKSRGHKYGMAGTRRGCLGRCFERVVWRMQGVREPVLRVIRQIPFRDMCSPPFVSALVAIFIGCVPPLKGALIGPAAPGGLAFSTMNSLAGACIPLMMLALGSTFADGPGAGTHLPKRAVLAVVAVRLFTLPLAGIAMLYALDALHVVPPEPLFRLAMLLQQTCPTAIMLQTLLLMLSTGAAEFGLLLFWQYIISIFTTPCWIMLYFKILGLSAD